MKALKGLLLLLLFLSPVKAFAWKLSPASQRDYAQIVSAQKLALEGWLRNLPDDADAYSFRELARGTFLWSLARPRGMLPSLLTFFSEADQSASSDPVELILKTERGEVLLWIRQENESCA